VVTDKGPKEPSSQEGQNKVLNPSGIFSCLDGYFKFMNVESKTLQSIFLECISKYGLCPSDLKTWKWLGFELHRQ
jgi:hypothetical protein